MSERHTTHFHGCECFEKELVTLRSENERLKEEKSAWEDRAAINGKNAFAVMDERDALREELKSARITHCDLNEEKHRKIMDLLHQAQTLRAENEQIKERLGKAEKLITEISVQFDKGPFDEPWSAKKARDYLKENGEK